MESNLIRSISLSIRGIQLKTTMRYHLTLVRMAKINKSGNNRYWQGYRERGTLYTVGGNANWCGHSGKLLKRLKKELPYNPAIALLGIYPKDRNIVV